MKINTIDEYNKYTTELLRNVETTKEHYTDDMLNDTFFKSNLVNATTMLLLKKATKQLKSTL